MNAANAFILKEPSVRAIVVGDRAVLVDRHGNRLSKYAVSLDRIVGAVDVANVEQWLWADAARRMAQRASRLTSQPPNPWKRRAETMAMSLRLRRRDDLRPRTKHRIEKFRTATWSAASERLAEQGLSSFRWHSRAGWDRWAQTSANNSNRRGRGE